MKTRDGDAVDNKFTITVPFYATPSRKAGITRGMISRPAVRNN